MNDTSRTPDVRSRVARAFKLAYGREATAEEHTMAAAFLDKQPPATALVDLCQMLLTSNEFLYIN